MTKAIMVDFDEILFEPREKNYGAYQIRKEYANDLKKAVLTIVFLSTIVSVAPLFWEKVNPSKKEDKYVVIKTTNFMPLPPPPKIEKVTPPPPKKEEVATPPPALKEVKVAIPIPKPAEEVRKPEEVKTNQELNDAPILGDKDKNGVENMGVPDGDPTIKEPAVVLPELPKEEPIVLKEEPKPEPPKPVDVPKETPKDEIPRPETFVIVAEQPKPINMKEIRDAIVFPQIIKESGQDGEVQLRILIDEYGNYMKHIVTKQSHPLLLKEVEKHVGKLKFTPAVQGKKAIKFWVNIPFKFKLT